MQFTLQSQSHCRLYQGRLQHVPHSTALQGSFVRSSFHKSRSSIKRPLHLSTPKTQENSDTSPTSYGEIQTVGSTGGSSSKSRLGFLDASADDDDLQSYKNAKREVQHDAEEAKQEAGNRFAAFKENITAATGDLQEDLQQLNVEELLENVADPKEFGKRGEPLFFGQLLLLVLIFFPPTFFKTLVSSIGLISIIGGLFTSILGVRDMGGSFYPFTAARKGNKLITKGLFRYVRHPIYCGLCFLSFGLCAVTGSQARLALSVAFWILLNYKANVEEAEMERIHGEQYSEYSSRVSKLVPGIF